jgi:DNA repair protein RecO (recombination protein O)
MPHFHDSAIVLRRLEYSETSQVLAIFGREYGQVRIIAKGSRRSTKKQFKPGLDLLEAGQVVFSARHVGQETLATLVEWKQERTFPELRDSLPRWHSAYYLADVTLAMTAEWDPHPGLYDALLDALATACQARDALAAVVAYQRTLLEQTGFLGDLGRCVGCGRAPGEREPLYFTFSEGGLLCRDCEPARVEKREVRVSIDALRRGVFNRPNDIGGAFDLFDYHLSHQMHRRPASAGALMNLVHSRWSSPR